MGSAPQEEAAKVIQLLLDAGASAAERDSFGQSAADKALALQRDSLLGTLSSSGRPSFSFSVKDAEEEGDKGTPKRSLDLSSSSSMGTPEYRLPRVSATPMHRLRLSKVDESMLEHISQQTQDTPLLCEAPEEVAAPVRSC